MKLGFKCSQKLSGLTKVLKGHRLNPLSEDQKKWSQPSRAGGKCMRGKRGARGLIILCLNFTSFLAMCSLLGCRLLHFVYLAILGQYNIY